MLLTQRVTFPVFGHETPARKRVALETNSEHIPDFPLGPGGGRPEVGDALVGRILSLERHLETDVLVPTDGEELIEERKFTQGLTGRSAPADALVDRAQVE